MAQLLLDGNDTVSCDRGMYSTGCTFVFYIRTCGCVKMFAPPVIGEDGGSSRTAAAGTDNVDSADSFSASKSAGTCLSVFALLQSLGDFLISSPARSVEMWLVATDVTRSVVCLCVGHMVLVVALLLRPL